jgi:parvulin-like peptidyl-prolyl isomerase
MSIQKLTFALLGVGCASLLAFSQGPVSPDKDVVAVVNDVPITRQQLADELIARKGRAQLEALVHRTLIEQTCKGKGVVVTDREVQEELVAEMKASASANLLDFEKSMLSPRKTSLFEYREDVIRPRLMIQKLAESQLALTDEDLKREFACRFGPKVTIRLITFKDQKIASKIWAEIRGNPELFIRYAKQQENIELAAVAGMMAPFGRHTTHDNIEQRAFELKPGEMSEVLQTAQQGYVVIMKEYDHPAQNVNFEDKKELIRQSAMEKKRQTEVPKIIAEIKSQASTRIKMYLDTTSDPARALEKYKDAFEKGSKR